MRGKVLHVLASRFIFNFTVLFKDIKIFVREVAHQDTRIAFLTIFEAVNRLASLENIRRTKKQNVLLAEFVVGDTLAESIFSTMKSRVVYPEYFVSIEDAERFVIEFVDWYNNEHLHSGLDLLPPCAVHFGYHQEILDRRNALLEKARELHPERFGGKRKIFKIDEFVCLKHRVHLQKAG